MKSFFAILSLFIFLSCGNEKSSNKSQSSNQYGTQSTGTLSIPAPGISGGSTTLLVGGSSLLMGTLSQTASNYLNALYTGQVNIQPISRDNYSTKYRVYFSGATAQGRCPFNPMAQCSVINLESLVAY